MALQNQHSHTTGSVPNLMPGQIAVNLKDKVIWLRAAGTKVAVDLDAWRTRGIPGLGANGAPLRRVSTGVSFDANLAPSCVVDGAVSVDPPGWGVPGLLPSSIGTPITVPANSNLIEPFYVASDVLSVTALMFKTTTPPAGAIRVGICDASGDVVVDHLVTVPALGVNTLSATADLSRGAYALVIWTEAEITLEQVFGYRPEQGWSEDGDGVPSFVSRTFGVQTDMSAGISVVSIGDVITSATPGEMHSGVIQWE